MQIDRDRIPKWAAYVVVNISNPNIQGVCSNIEKVLEVLVREGWQFDANVIRVDGDVTVWPIESKGGDA